MKDLMVIHSNDIQTITDEEGVWVRYADIMQKIGIQRSKTVKCLTSELTRVRHKIFEILVSNGRGGNRRCRSPFVLQQDIPILLGSKVSDRAKAVAKEIVDRMDFNFKSVLEAIDNFELPEDMDDDLFLYAIREDTTGNIKIGISRDPERRLKQLSTGNSSNLTLIMTKKAENRFQDERAIHDKLKTSRVRGEWFMPGVEDAIIAA